MDNERKLSHSGAGFMLAPGSALYSILYTWIAMPQNKSISAWHQVSFSYQETSSIIPGDAIRISLRIMEYGIKGPAEDICIFQTILWEYGLVFSEDVAS